MKALIAALFLISSAHAMAAPTISAQTCTNASRGVVLILPAIVDGKLTGSLRVTKLVRTISEVQPGAVADLKVSDDGLVSFNGKDGNGDAVKVSSERDSVGRLVVQVSLKNLGTIGYTCPQQH